MEFIIDAFTRALHLIVSLDAELAGIVLLSVRVSGIAALIASCMGLAVTLGLDLADFRGKGFFVALLNTSMGLPPVVVGLVLYMLLSRSGPLGFLGLLYTPSAMVIAQVILAAPIIAGISYASVASADPSVRFAALTLGATPFQAGLKVMRHARYAIFSSVLAGMGRIVAEVGAVLVVGGNIAGYTRVMTTAIALESDKGDFTLAIALGIILLGISFLLNMSLYLLQGAHR